MQDATLNRAPPLNILNEKKTGVEDDSRAWSWITRHRCVGLYDPLAKETDGVGADTREADEEVKMVEEESRKKEIGAKAVVKQLHGKNWVIELISPPGRLNYG